MTRLLQPNETPKAPTRTPGWPSAQPVPDPDASLVAKDEPQGGAAAAAAAGLLLPALAALAALGL